MNKRLIVMAHFDIDGEIAPHVRRQVAAASRAADRFVLVTTARLTPESRAWLIAHAEVVERANDGHDFVSYRVGLAEAGDLTGYDEVVICNDSWVGPLRPYARIFGEMQNRPVDFWGLTESRRIAPHVQSFFAVFRSWVVGSRAFTRFWSSLTPQSDRREVIRRYEVGLSTQLIETGFVAGSYFVPAPDDLALARRRMRWWAAHRPPGIRPNRAALRVLRSRAAEPWNPAIALADRALPDGRMPFVKIDTLRYDPYHLGSDRLLAACERSLPRCFEGVRDYLRRTTDAYRRRTGEETLDTPAVLRPVAPYCGYQP